MQLCGVEIVDTFAEAFSMSGTRLVITAVSERWALVAANEFCGNATSVIGCDTEASIERILPPEATPDGRPGVTVLAFAFNRDALSAAVTHRIGQCVLTCPTTSCFNGVTECAREKRIAVGSNLRFFGDGLQTSKKLGDRRLWRMPCMDGEFVCDDKFGTFTGVAGGNLLLCGENQSVALMAAEAASEAMSVVPGVILPFPGGIVRSGSKVGSIYKKLKASTNDAYCPTVRPLSKSELPERAQAVYELVVDGENFELVKTALREGLHAACAVGGLVQVTAGNYGGKLGKHHFHLRDLIP